jgi:hypothetical protein
LRKFDDGDGVIVVMMNMVMLLLVGRILFFILDERMNK